MTRRRAAMLGVLVLGFVGVGMAGACAPSEPGSVGPGVDPPEPLGESALAVKGTFPPNERASLGSSPPIPREPLECSDMFIQQCKRYRIQLLGDTMNPALRAKYKAAFGSACYVSVSNTFDCFYKDPLKACEDGVLVPDVFGAAEYDKTYNCQQVKGTKDWWRQVGPDPAIKIDITYQDAPLETSLIDVDGVPTAINGPYRNLPEPSKVLPGKEFRCYRIDGVVQRERILEINKKAHGGKIHSDFAGFTWPCNEKDKPICTEETELIDGSPDLAKAVQVHHEVRAADLRGCRWGTNSNTNAVVISRKLNRFFWYKYPSKEEVDWVNKLAPYTP
ncbi:MAG: hypothetical protein IPM54_42145 [Polyangiaceae bacterium]|nr:hypothetical protein [Polyangiaceae bacterium]